MRRAMVAIGRAGAILAMLAAAIAGPAAGAPAPGGIDLDFLIGRWTDDGDCANAVSLASDGRFTTAGGKTGLWVLDGDRLTMTGEQTLVLRVSPVDRNTISVVNPDGAPGGSTRCGTDGPGRHPPPPRVDAAYFVGRWTDDDNCANAATFLADGRFTASNGGLGHWTLAGSEVTLTGTATRTLRLVAIDRDIVMVIKPDGSLGRSTRC